MTWHGHLGHPAFKTVIALAENGADSMVITDLPAKIPRLDACVACVAAKSAHLPHKEGRERADKKLQHVHIDMAGPISVKSAGGNECDYVVLDDSSRAVYSMPLCLKLEAADAFKTFKAAAENESDNKLREVMTDNARELSMGEMRTICDEEGIRFSTTVPYHPASNGIAERAIGVLTNATCAVVRNGLWGKARCRPFVRIRRALRHC